MIKLSIRFILMYLHSYANLFLKRLARMFVVNCYRLNTECRFEVTIQNTFRKITREGRTEEKSSTALMLLLGKTMHVL